MDLPPYKRKKTGRSSPSAERVNAIISLPGNPLSAYDEGGTGKAAPSEPGATSFPQTLRETVLRNQAAGAGGNDPKPGINYGELLLPSLSDPPPVISPPKAPGAARKERLLREIAELLDARGDT
ncbi:MAG: hypothetical protein HYU64_02275 [Armatimonadetes bacterium]|nr:hypothetical protein [Armatimonadota bacterium]